MTAPINLDGTTSRAVNLLMAEAAHELAIIRFCRGVDDVNERLAALDADIAKMEALHG